MQIRERGAVLPHHVLVGMQAIVMEEVDAPELFEQWRQLSLAIADDQVPAVLELSRDEKIVRRFVWIIAEIDAVERAALVVMQRLKDVRARRPVAYARLHDDIGLQRPH